MMEIILAVSCIIISIYLLGKGIVGYKNRKITINGEEIVGNRVKRYILLMMIICIFIIIMAFITLFKFNR